MNQSIVPVAVLLHEVMQEKGRLPSQLAAEIGVSHATMSRWLAGQDVPSPRSCRRLADYSGICIQKVLFVAGHMPRVVREVVSEWPEFREYARLKYPDELDESTVGMIEDLIARRRVAKNSGG
jgi:hypothetical protein